MDSITGTYIKPAVVGPADYLESKKGEILFCRKDTGRGFSAKLIDIDGHKLIFQNSAGDILVDDFRRLVYISDRPWNKEAV
jgi:hypothetical protein